MTDIVKSAYMIDPSDGLTLVKREEGGEAGSDIDREYWQRVNQVSDQKFLIHFVHNFYLQLEIPQGANVLNAAKMFEQSTPNTDNTRREPVRSENKRKPIIYSFGFRLCKELKEWQSVSVYPFVNFA